MRSSILSSAMILLVPFAGAAQWLPTNDPASDAIEFYLPWEGDLYVGGTLGLVYETFDNGTTWTSVGGGLTIEYAPVVGMAVAGDWFIMSRAVSPDHNFRCRFDGEAWGEWTLLAFQDDMIRSFAVIEEVVFAVIDGDVHRSDDFGASWDLVPQPGASGVQKIVSVEGRLFAAENVINGGEIHRSDDLGETWTPVMGPMGSSYLLSNVYFQDRLYMSVYHNGGIGSIWVSDDFGDGWVQVTGLPTDANINGMALTAGGVAIGASGSDNEGRSIYVSPDFAVWESYTGDLPQFARPVNQLVSHNGWFFKTGGSVTSYRAPHPEAASVEDESLPAARMSLSASPNPFRSGTSIRYRIPESGHVRLTIHDVNGRLVRRLPAGMMSAGDQSTGWDGRDEAGRPVGSGVYLLNLSAGSGTSREKVLVTR